MIPVYSAAHPTPGDGTNGTYERSKLFAGSWRRRAPVRVEPAVPGPGPAGVRPGRPRHPGGPATPAWAAGPWITEAPGPHFPYPLVPKRLATVASAVRVADRSRLSHCPAHGANSAV